MEREVYQRIRELEQAHWWFTARREILADQIARLGLPANANILEVGCGTGGNLEMLGRFGMVCAIEPDDEARAYAANRSGVTVRGGLLPNDLPAFGCAFDLVAAFDVIEHVDDDVSSLAALAQLLQAGGRLIATVPANQWMWSEHDVHHHHKRRYELSQFAAVLAEAGLELRKATYFNTLLFPVIGAVRLSKRALRLAGGDDESMPGPLVNGVLRRVFAAERGLLRGADLPFGVSILAIAQRPVRADEGPSVGRTH